MDEYEFIAVMLEFLQIQLMLYLYSQKLVEFIFDIAGGCYDQRLDLLEIDILL